MKPFIHSFLTSLLIVLPVFLFSLDIFEASETGDLPAVRKMIESGEATVKDANELGRTALHLSCFKGQTETAAYLLQKGADIDARSRNGMTPLHLAVIGNRVETARFLLTNHAAWNKSDKAGFGMKPVHYACINGNLEMLKMLIEEFGIDINSMDNNETTILMYAARRSSRTRGTGPRAPRHVTAR